MSIAACTGAPPTRLLTNSALLGLGLPHTSLLAANKSRVYYTNSLSIRPYLTGAIRLLFGSTT